MKRILKILNILFFIISIIKSQNEEGFKVSKHSFSSPFLFGITSSIPYWEYGSSAVATENFVRLTPAIQSRTGWIWNTEKVWLKEWQVTLKFNIHNIHQGADGIGFWYSKQPKQEGKIFGNSEHFNGIGILFDTYDNNGDGDNPSIIAIKGTGKEDWDYDNDFKKNQLDRCRAELRNPYNGYVTVKITYIKNSLNVMIDNIGNGDFSHCLIVRNIELPRGYYFGITASTGGLADYHDIISLETKNLGKIEDAYNENEINSEEVKKEPDTYKGVDGHWDPYEFYKQYDKYEKEKKVEEQKSFEQQEQQEKQHTSEHHSTHHNEFKDIKPIDIPLEEKKKKRKRRRRETSSNV